MRRKFTETDRQRYLAELKDSGETPWRFARRIGITPGSLYRWMRLHPQSSGAKFARLVPERRSGEPSVIVAGRISVQIGDALVQVEPGFDAGLLRDIVAALASKGQL
jgi:transposase-like protein